VDSRKAPAEAAPEPEVVQDSPISPPREEAPSIAPAAPPTDSDIQRFPLPPTLPPIIPEPMVSNTDLVPELPGVATPNSQILESPRVAVKLKLCIECSTRHFQDSCPLHNPDIEVNDFIFDQRTVL